MKLRATVIALVVGGLGALLLLTYMKRFEAEASGGPRVPVLVVLHTLDPGALLKDEDVAERAIPQAYVESRAIRASDRSRVTNLRVRAPLQAQQTLMWTDIAAVGDDKHDVSALVQPGMRAVTIRAEGKASALVRPGDRVDVLATFAQTNAPDQRTGVVLLQNVLVLGRSGDATTTTRNGADGSDLALSLTLQNAQILAVAADKGKLSVALRSPEDVRIQEGLADISSTILAEAEKRAAVVRTKQGPARMESVVR